MIADKGRAAVPSEVVFYIIMIRAICRREGCLIALLTLPTALLIDELIEISLWQPVLFQKTDIISFNNILQSPEIAPPLVRRLIGAVDDTQVGPEGILSRQTNRIPQIHIKSLVE